MLNMWRNVRHTSRTPGSQRNATQKKFKLSKHRKLQIRKASQKYNSSDKGKKRQQKYEKSVKGKKRRERYKRSLKGRETTRQNAISRRQRKQQEQEALRQQQRLRRKEELKRDEEEETKLWHDMLRKGGLTHYINGKNEQVCLYPNQCTDKECPNSNRNYRKAN